MNDYKPSVLINDPCCKFSYSVVINIYLLELKVNESFPFSIALSWKGSAPDAQNGGTENQQSTIVFPKGNPIPSIKALTFYRQGTFSVDVLYADPSELQAPAKISTYTVSSYQYITAWFSIAFDHRMVREFRC